MVRCSLGIMAYNEEANIARLLEAVLSQCLDKCNLHEIFVVASGCTDRTVEIAQSYTARDSRICVLVQQERKGKASAINLFLEKATGEVLIVESGDTIPGRLTYELLVQSFRKSSVGMAGSRPVPVNAPNNFMGFVVHFMWGLHHEIASCSPKLGELIAFRNLVRKIPPETAVDEASIEQIVTRAGYTLAYVPQAVVYNRGPETLGDFLRQRRRIANGHLYLKHTQGYAPSTFGTALVFQAIGRRFKVHLRRIGRLWRSGKYGKWLAFLLRELKRSVWVIGGIGLEVVARLIGWYDFRIRRKNPTIWKPSLTTKHVAAPRQ